MIKKIFNFYKECPARMKQLDISPRNIEKKFDTLNAGDGLDIATQLGRGGMLFIASPPHVFYSIANLFTVAIFERYG